MNAATSTPPKDMMAYCIYIRLHQLLYPVVSVLKLLVDSLEL